MYENSRWTRNISLDEPAYTPLLNIVGGLWLWYSWERSWIKQHRYRNHLNRLTRSMKALDELEILLSLDEPAYTPLLQSAVYDMYSRWSKGKNIDLEII